MPPRKSVQSSAGRCLLFVLLFTVLPLVRGAGSVAEASEFSRFFIRVETPPDFPTLPRELLTVIQENLPVSALRARGLLYDDPSEYLDLQNWNPNDAFVLRDPKEIKRRLTQLNMTKMLTISLSPLPGKPSSLLLTGRLMDLSMMNEILATCLESATARQNPDKCPLDATVFRAVAVASTELANFEEFKSGLRRLFEKLLTIPSIDFHNPPATGKPNDRLSLGIRLITNESEALPTYRLAKSSRKHSIAVESITVTEDEPFCQDPEKYWKQLVCDSSESKADCKTVFKGISRHKIVVSQDVVALGSAGESLFYARTSLPGVVTNLLVRIQAIADEDGNLIYSLPKYACIHVRESKSRFIEEFLYTTSFDSILSDTDPSLFQATSSEGLGMLMSLGKVSPGALNSHFFSSGGWGGFISLRFLSWDLFCVRQESICSQTDPTQLFHTVLAAQITAGPEYSVRLFKYNGFSIDVILRAGGGLNYLFSAADLPRLGAYASLSGSVALRAGYSIGNVLPLYIGTIPEVQFSFREPEKTSNTIFNPSSALGIVWLTAGLGL